LRVRRDRRRLGWQVRSLSRPGAGLVTRTELEKAVLFHEAEGLLHMAITVKRSREPHGRRVRALPGVAGIMLSYAGGDLTVEVATADMRRFLDRRCT
jgi:hypothetical protein